MLAFCAHFGHQPLSELRRLTANELRLFHDALVDIVKNIPILRL